MNWSELGFDWNQIRAFLATVEEGSLSAAARALALTQPTLSRQIAALEADLGVVLFERIGKRLEPTPTARELITHVRAMGEAASRVSLVASGQSQDIAGKVRITASDAMSAYLLPKIVAQIRADAPGLEIELIAANDIRDLQHREADIAIRHVRPTEPELIARHLPDSRGYFYGSTGYLAERGRPRVLEDLNAHDIISPGDVARLCQYLAAFGLTLDPKACKIVSENGVVAWQLVQEGLGLMPMTDVIARLTPGVEAVLEDVLTIPVSTWLTTHRELHTARRIRLVFDILAAALAAHPISARSRAR